MKVLGIDVECSKLPNINPWQEGSFLSAVGIGLRFDNKTQYKTWVFYHDENKKSEHEYIKEIQEAVDMADLIVGHNLKFDVNWLRSIGIVIPNEKLFCTQVAEYMLRGQRKGISYSLNASCARYKLQQKHDKVKAYWDSGIDTNKIPLRILLPYLEQDVKLTLDLYERQLPVIEAKGMKTVADLCFEVSGILSEAELYGFALDKELADKLIEEYKVKLNDYDNRLTELSGFDFNPGSNLHLSVAMYGGTLRHKVRVQKEKTLKSGRVKTYEVWGTEEVHYDGLKIKPLVNTESAREGYYATNKDVLKSIKTTNAKQDEFVDLLLERSNAQKVLQTFTSDRSGSAGLCDIVGSDGCIHPNFNQTVTATGRLSSSKPNGQNLPRKGTSPVKQVVLSRNGRILNVDLGQIEWRMAAELSRDPVALREIKEGIDAHADNAIKFFGADKYSKDSLEFKKLRTDAKIFLFRMIYGGTAAGFYRDRKMPDYTLEEWKEIVRKFKEKYARLSAWQQENIAEVLKTGRLVTFSGRILTFPKVAKYDGSYGPNDKAICNYPVQSISADMIYIAMVEVMRRMRKAGLKSKLILMVHDSMVFDAFENEIDKITKISIDVFEEIPEICKKLFMHQFEVPLTGDAELGLTYGDIVEYTMYTTNAEKHLVKFLNPDSTGALKTQYMWVLNKQDVLVKHPEAEHLEILDTINPD